MRGLALLLSALTSLVALDKKIEIGTEGIIYSEYHNEMVAKGKATINSKNSLFETYADIDFLYSSEYQDRRYILLNELYLSKEFDKYRVDVGKEIKYWGELEGYNIADIYNPKNYLQDPFDKSAKYGVWGLNITEFYDENSLEFGVKLYEQDIKLPQNRTPYAIAQPYSKELKLSHNQETPTLYLKSNIVTDEDIDSESSIILLHGYDNKRYFVPNPNQTLSQYAYRVNKTLLLSHILYRDTILKGEFAYTDVVDSSNMSDYMQFGLGVEKGIYGVLGYDISLYGEYYRYIYQDNSKIEEVDISEIYDSDIFIATKINLNNTQSSEIKFGILQDTKKEERVLKVEIKSRLWDSVMVNTEYLKVSTDKQNTVLGRLGDSSRLSFSIMRSF